MALNDSKELEMAQMAPNSWNGSKWLIMAQNCSKLLEMAQKDSKWLQLTQNGSKYLEALRMVQISTKVSNLFKTLLKSLKQ